MLTRWLFLLALPLLAQSPKTIVKDEATRKLLAGEHKLTLQWLDKAPGKATVTNSNGTLAIKGEAKEQTGTGFVKVDGVITEIGPKAFKIKGTIVTRVSYINKGQACERKGDFHFLIKGPRAFFRMREINNPCDEAADYVDIYWK